MKFLALLFTTLTFCGTLAFAAKNDPQTTQTLTIFENGKFNERFQARCDYLEDQANSKLQLLSRLDVLLAKSEAFDSHRTLHCGRDTHSYCGEAFQRICHITVKADTQRFLLKVTHSEKRRLHGERAQKVCKADYDAAVANPLLIVSKIVEKGIFKPTCFVESIEAVLNPL